MNIYVGNIERSVTDSTLRPLFEKLGQVISVKIIKDKISGQSRGFAFVRMAEEEQGKAAITELDGYELEGRRLQVKQAHDKPGFAPRGGGNMGNRSF